jgi:hypothetical protein
MVVKVHEAVRLRAMDWDPEMLNQQIELLTPARGNYAALWHAVLHSTAQHREVKGRWG